MGVKAGGKVILVSFLKLKEDARWGDRPEREGRIEELVGGQNPGPEAPPPPPPGARKEQTRYQERGAM